MTWKDSRRGRCEHCVDEGHYGVTKSRAAQVSTFEQWLLRRIGFAQDGPLLPIVSSLSVGLSIDLFQAIGELHQRGYGYLRDPYDDSTLEALVTSGFSEIAEDRFEEVITRVVGGYRLHSAMVAPKRSHEALGWFGLIIWERFRGLPTILHDKLLAAMSDGLGYQIDSLDRSPFMTIEEAAYQVRVSPSQMKRILEAEGELDACITPEGQILLPFTAVGELRRRYGVW